MFEEEEQSLRAWRIFLIPISLALVWFFTSFPTMLCVLVLIVWLLFAEAYVKNPGPAQFAKLIFRSLGLLVAFILFGAFIAPDVAKSMTATWGAWQTDGGKNLKVFGEWKDKNPIKWILIYVGIVLVCFIVQWIKYIVKHLLSPHEHEDAPKQNSRISMEDNNRIHDPYKD